MARTTTAPEIKPWERQIGEGVKAYEAFTKYRDMGAERSLAKVGRLLGKSTALMEKWSVAHGWVDRVTAWDHEQDRLLRIQQLEDIKKMRKNHANIASAMIVKAAKALQRIPEDEIKAADISRMVEVASKLERISRGDVGEVVEQRDGGKSDDRVQFYIPMNGRDQDREDDDDI